MIRKDYQILANILKQLKKQSRIEDNCVFYFANALETESSSFNREKFLKACGVINTEGKEQ